MHTQPSDRDIKTSLEEMDERINQRLDTVEGSIEQIQTTGDDQTGTFLDPAHNCSHILLDHPGSPSGSDIHTYLWVVLNTHR